MRTILAALLLVVYQVLANSQVLFDNDNNLYLLGVNDKDFSAGTKKEWNSSKSFSKLSKGDKPSFDTTAPNCWLSQYNNGGYCLNVDNADKNSIYILDFSNKEWKKYDMEGDLPDFDKLKAVLDHDTNVWYGVSDKNLYSLEMGENLLPDDTLTWKKVQEVPFDVDDDVVIGLASNHLHFINDGGLDKGEAELFVIHYSYFQPEKQKYGDFEQSKGQAVSVFKESKEWQTKFWFLPENLDNSYLIDVDKNTTETYKGPSNKDANSAFSSNDQTLVQLTSTNQLYYLDFSTGNSAEWKQIENTALPLPSSNNEEKDTSNSKAFNINYALIFISLLLILVL